VIATTTKTRKAYNVSITPIGSNQTELRTANATVLFSYQTPVAACVGGTFYRTEQHYSKTTSRHINAWLDGRKAETKPESFFQNLVDGQPVTTPGY
jgi:hypothetical protein